MTSRHLITTALEDSWDVNSPVVFADDSACCLYDRKYIWEEMDSKTVPYHWNDKNKQEVDYKYLSKIYEDKLIEFTNHLNGIHGVSHSLRYWRIVFGPWLAYFIHILFDRWQTILQAKRLFSISNTIILDFDNSKITPTDMNDFLVKIKSDEWNHIVYGSILETELTKDQIIYKLPRKKKNTCFEFKSLQIIKSKIKNIISAISFSINRRSKNLIADSYLNISDIINLNIRLGGFPIIYNSVKLSKTQVDYNYRESLDLHLNATDDFEKILVRNMIKFIPTCYLEGFGILQTKVNNLNWNKDPRIIFSSNFLYYDVIAMVYTAEKLERGTKLIYGQHGGIYGQALFSWAEEHELKIADIYLSWGWVKSGYENIIPLGMLKRGKYKRIKFSKQQTFLLLVLTSAPRYSFRLDSSIKKINLSHIESDLSFAEKLKDSIRERHLLVRHHHADNGWSQVSRWRDRFPSLHSDIGISKISKLVRKSKIVIYTCNSTGYLEYLAHNVPTIIYFSSNIEPIRNEAKPYFQKLKDVGIYHESPESAAIFVNSIWGDVRSWWMSENVQLAKDQFCNEFALCNDTLIEDLINIFSKVEEQKIHNS
jgi:putative transferase (TIGR04331 family)